MSNSWQYNALKLTSRLVCFLPYSVVLLLGRLLGRLYYYLVARQRQRAVAEMNRALGLSDLEADALFRRLCQHVGQTFFEVLYMPALTPGNISKYVQMEGAQYLRAAVAEGRGVVLLTAHIGNWEWLGAALAMAGFPMATVIKRQPNEQYTRILNEYREMVGLEIFARGTTELIGAARALKHGKVLGFLADQDAGPHGYFMPFLGKMASTPPGPAVFAEKFHAPVIPAFIVRRPEGGHRVLIQPPLYLEDTGDKTADLYTLTEKMTRITETVIKDHPDQWLWFQKRWNTPYSEKPQSVE